MQERAGALCVCVCVHFYFKGAKVDFVFPTVKCYLIQTRSEQLIIFISDQITDYKAAFSVAIYFFSYCFCF